MLKLKQLLTFSLLVFTLILSGCSYHGAHKPSVWSNKKEVKESPDGPPDQDIDVTHIPNAMPKVEPLSRYGNPAKYEVFGVNYHTMPHSRGYSAKGIASWYGRKFHGLRTSSGEPYDMYGMTAAHRSLPLPTYAKVKNLHNGREVIVKINDRGPFVKDRLIDLSYAAAKKLGIHASGTGNVEITAIDPSAWHKQQKEIKIAQKPKTTPKQKGQSTPTQVAKASTKQKAQPTTKVAQTATKQAAQPATKVAKATTKQNTQATTKVAQTATKPKAKANDKKSTQNTQLAKANKQLYIQLGAFVKESNAQQLAKQATTLTQALDHVGVKVLAGKSEKKDSYKVRIGPLKDEKQAQSLQKKLVALNGANQSKLIYD